MAPKAAQQARRAHVFISYKRTADPDEVLALFLAKALSLSGCLTFIDQTIPLGSNWGDAIDRNIDESDIFLLLLSNNSIHSKEVLNELRRARDFASKQREIVPIKIGLQGSLPFEMRSIVDSVQYFKWNTDQDSQKLINHLATLIRTAGFAMESIAVDSEISSTASPRFALAREALIPFLDDCEVEIAPTDDTLFVVHQTEFLLEMFLIAMEPIVSGGLIPPPGIDQEMINFKTMINSALAYASTPGKDTRLAENLREMSQTFDDAMNRVLPRLREIPREARYAGWDEDDKISREKAHEYKARGGLTTSDLVPEIADGVSDILTRNIKNRRRLDDALRRERIAFQLLLEERYASIAGRMGVIAQARRWKAGSWGFDIDPDTRRKIRQSCNKSKSHELFQIWKNSWFRRSTDPFPFILYFTFASDPTEMVALEEYLQMAVRGTLMVPPSPAHDEWRSALFGKASRFALLKVSMIAREAGSYLAINSDFAKAVDRCFDIKNQHFFPEDQCDLRRRKIILLAGAQRFDEAFNLALSEEPSWKDNADMCLHAARIASLAGKHEYALHWLRLRVKNMPPLNFRNLNDEKDLKGLREANPQGISEMLKPSYKLEWKNCFFLADLLLTNSAIFPVSNVTVTCTVNGQKYVKHCQLLASGASYKWTNVSMNVGTRNTLVTLTNYTVESEQGTYRG